MGHGFGLGDGAAFKQRVERLVEGAHAHFAAALHGGAQALDLALLDQVGDIVRQQHDLHRWHPAALRSWHQALPHHRLEVERQIHEQLPVRLFGKEVQHPLHGLAGVVGVQCGHTQVACFGIVQCVLHGRAVADLPDHDHIGRLAHGMAQGFVVGQGVQPHFALRHQRFLVRMQVFDGVFHRQDMARRVLVAVVQHGSQCGGLARARCAHHEDQPVLEKRQLFEHRRQMQVIDRRNLR